MTYHICKEKEKQRQFCL